MPSVPIEMASLTPTVLNLRGIPLEHGIRLLTREAYHMTHTVPPLALTLHVRLADYQG